MKISLKYRNNRTLIPHSIHTDRYNDRPKPAFYQPSDADVPFRLLKVQNQGQKMGHYILMIIESTNLDCCFHQKG